MLSKVKPLYAIKRKFAHINKFYCSDKIKDLQQIRIQKEKKTELLQQVPDIIVESYEECTKFEEKVVKQVIIEKEKDATLQSRLSKECENLFSTPVSKLGANKCGSLRLDQITLHNGTDYPNWGTYSFDQLQDHLSTKPSPSHSIQNPKNKASPGSGEQERDSEPVKSKVVPQAAGDSGATSGSIIKTTTRPIRQEPGKVLFCFIPEEWWRIFIPKTGVTGFGTFLFTFATFMVSKEIYVLEHYYYHGLGSLCLWIGGIKYIGPPLSKWLDKEVDQFEKEWNQGRVNEKQSLEDDIVHELLLQFQSEGQLLLIDAKRENVHLQLEEEFRKRQMLVYQTVKQRLDYHIALELVKQRVQQKNLVEYVTREVKKAITPEMENKLIYYSIDRIVHDLNQEEK